MGQARRRMIVCAVLGLPACWRGQDAAPAPVEPARPPPADVAIKTVSPPVITPCDEMTFDSQSQRCKRVCPYDAFRDLRRRRQFRDALVGRGYSCTTSDPTSCAPPRGALKARLMKSPLRSDTMVVIGAGSQQGVAIHQRAVLLDGAGTPQERGELRLTKVDKNRTIGVARDWCVLHESDHVLFEP